MQKMVSRIWHLCVLLSYDFLKRIGLPNHCIWDNLGSSGGNVSYHFFWSLLAKVLVSMEPLGLGRVSSQSEGVLV
jgi:hypothetical protein